MADSDEPPGEIVPFRPRREPLSGEARDDAQWELLARREARMGRSANDKPARIPGRIRWWIAAFFIVALVIVFRDRIAAWLPGLGF